MPPSTGTPFRKKPISRDPGSREHEQHQGDGDSGDVASAAAYPRDAACACDGDREGDGDEYAKRGERIGGLGVEIGLIDDPWPEDGGAEHAPGDGQRCPQTPGRRSKISARIAIATSAVGKFRNTSARLAPPAIPLPETW